MRWVLLVFLLCVSQTSSSVAIQVPSAGDHEEPGTVLWSVDVGGEIWSPLRVSDNVLYFGCDDGSVYALH